MRVCFFFCSEQVGQKKERAGQKTWNLLQESKDNEYVIEIEATTYRFKFIEFGAATWRVAVSLYNDLRLISLTDINSMNTCISFNAPPSHKYAYIECGRFFLIKQHRGVGHGSRICKALCFLYFLKGASRISVIPAKSSLARHFWCSTMGFRKEEMPSMLVKERCVYDSIHTWILKNGNYVLHGNHVFA